MKLCPQCLATFGDEKKFCSECGTALIEDPDAKTADPEKKEEPEVPAEELSGQEEGKEPAKEPEKEAEADDRPSKPGYFEAKKEERRLEKEAREAKKEERRREKEAREAARRAPLGAGRRITAILLSLLLFLFAFVGTFGAELRLTTSEEGLKAALEEIDLGSVRLDPFFDDVDEEMSFSALLSEDLGKSGYIVSEKTVSKILRNSTVKSFLAEQFAGVFEDIYSGRSRYEFDPEELADELMSSKNARVFEKENVVLTRSDAEAIAEMIDGYGLGEFLNLDEIREEAPGLYQALHFGLSVFALGGLAVLILLLVGLIFKANKGRAGYSFGDIGGALIAVGAILSLTALLAKLLPETWQSLIGAVLGAEDLEALVAQGSGALLISNLRVSLSVFGAGLLLAILGRLLRGRRRPKDPGFETP